MTWPSNVVPSFLVEASLPEIKNEIPTLQAFYALFLRKSQLGSKEIYSKRIRCLSCNVFHVRVFLFCTLLLSFLFLLSLLFSKNERFFNGNCLFTFNHPNFDSDWSLKKFYLVLIPFITNTMVVNNHSISFCLIVRSHVDTKWIFTTSLLNFKCSNQRIKFG